MKTITGIFMLSALVIPPAPALAQGNLQYQVERIVDYALTIAADALGEVAGERADRQRQRGRASDDRGPQYRDTFTKTVRLGRNGRLELENLSGDVDITASSGDDVKVTATKSVRANGESEGRAALTATEINVTERPGLVTITSRPTRGRFSSIAVDYVIAVPVGTSLSVKTLSGDVTVSGISGDVRVNTTSGDVVLKGGRPRDVDVEVVSGDIALEQVESERVRAKSLSGDIVFRGTIAKNGRYDLGSHSGDIQVIPDGNPGFNLEAGTFSGDVSSDFAVRLGGATSNGFASTGRGPRRSSDVRGSVNDGGAQLILHSFSGDILITKR
jgi:hypothetical protein